MPTHRAEELAEKLSNGPGVEWAGLGARDILRLEAGLCLYGNDISENTTPIEAGLAWCISKSQYTVSGVFVLCLSYYMYMYIDISILVHIIHVCVMSYMFLYVHLYI